MPSDELPVVPQAPPGFVQTLDEVHAGGSTAGGGSLSCINDDASCGLSGRRGNPLQTDKRSRPLA